MNKLLVVILLIIGLIILNNKIKNSIQEGFTQCEYREKQNTGTMCKEKWGEPECNKWEPSKKIRNLNKIKTYHNNDFVPLRGYQKNTFMYEIDYDEILEEKSDESNESDKSDESDEVVEVVEVVEVNEVKEVKSVPKGVHTNYFI